MAAGERNFVVVRVIHEVCARFILISLTWAESIGRGKVGKIRETGLN